MKKNLLTHVLTLVAAIGLLTLLVPGQAAACSCLFEASPSATINKAPVIFSGKVSTIVADNPQDKLSSKTVYLSTIQTWKGQDMATNIVHTDDAAVGCGFPFQENQEYLVFATQNAGKLETSVCSGTQALALAESHLSVLQATFPNSSPRPTTPPNSEAIDSNYLMYFTLALAAAVIVTPIALAAGPFLHQKYLAKK
jgi:hypothetical protein